MGDSFDIPGFIPNIHVVQAIARWLDGCHVLILITQEEEHTILVLVFIDPE